MTLITSDLSVTDCFLKTVVIVVELIIIIIIIIIIIRQMREAE